MYTQHKRTLAPELAPLQWAELLAAASDAITGDADNWQRPEGWAAGDFDGCWEHPAAAEARRLTREAGLSWDFTTWTDAYAMLCALKRAADNS